MRIQHGTLEADASSSPFSAILATIESSRLDASTRVNLSGQDASSRKITSSHLPEPAATDPDSLTAAWAAEVRTGNIALAAHLIPLCPGVESAASPAEAGTEAVEKAIRARSSTVNALACLWRERHGDFYLAMAMVVVATVIPWAIWSK